MNNTITALRNSLPKLTKEDVERIFHFNFYERWVKKFDDLSYEDKVALVTKVKQKYDSYDYLRREVNMGYDPRQRLYTILWKWSEEHGESVVPSTDFCVAKYKILDKFYICLFIGQGSFINVKYIGL